MEATGQGRSGDDTLSRRGVLGALEGGEVAARSLGSTVSTCARRGRARRPRCRGGRPAYGRGRSSQVGLSWKPGHRGDLVVQMTATMFDALLDCAFSSAGIPEWKKVESPRKPTVRSPVVRADSGGEREARAHAEQRVARARAARRSRACSSRCR